MFFPVKIKSIVLLIYNNILVEVEVCMYLTLCLDDQWVKNALTPLSESSQIATMWLQKYFDAYGDKSPTTEKEGQEGGGARGRASRSDKILVGGGAESDST